MKKTDVPCIPIEVQELFDIFDNQIRLVGGCVRDLIRQKPLHDYDFATPLKPEKVIQILEENQINHFDSGIKHGTITAVYKNIPYEITTLRADIQTDGRHAKVTFVNSYQADAMRRDFTMNALYMDKEGVIYDYTNGKEDILKKRIRFIGNPAQRVQEDYLRILRYFRFLADFGTHELHQPSLEACRLYAPQLHRISIERIRSEILRLLAYNYALQTLYLMHKNQILSFILPTYRLEDLDAFLKIYPQATIWEKLAVLVPQAYQLNWKWSREQKKQLENLSRPITITENMRQNRYILWQAGQSNYLFYIAKALFKKTISNQTAQEAQKQTIPFFPVKGADMAQIGFKGAEIMHQLKIAETLWVKMNFPVEKKLVIDSVLEYNKKRS